MKEERFWKNYFFHCEQTRAEQLGLSDTKNHSSHTKPAGVIETIANNANMREKLDLMDSSVDKVEDDESLVPASEADDSSYVLTSAPATGNTFTSTRSVDDLVLVNSELNPRANA